MSREVHVRFCESRGVRFPPATLLVVLVKGTRTHAQALCEQAAVVLAPMGLGLSAAKTRITHIDEGFDFLGFSPPAAAPARHDQAAGLHLSVQEGPCGHHRQGADPDPPNSEPITGGPAVPTQPGAAGLVRLLPLWGVQPQLRLPGGLRLASDPPVAAAPASPEQLEDPAPSLPSRMAADTGRGGDVSAQHGAGLPLPLPGPPHPDPMGDCDGTDRKARGMNSWRAGCVETRTSGSEGGLRKRTGRKTGTAPQPDPYVWRD
jgi:hypothetical protein